MRAAAGFRSERRQPARGVVLSLATILGILGAGVACSAGGNGEGTTSDPEGHARRERLEMVEAQLVARGVTDPRVLTAMRKVPRHLFVPAHDRSYAYSDGPLPIGHEQTISQPYIVAIMTALLRPTASMKVLEVGTGSGYQAAVLAECVSEVFTIEIVEPLGRRAEALLRELGYGNIHVRIGDGYDGWPEEAPFDAIVVTAAPERVPEPLVAQLRVGGRLVLPLGAGVQDLVVLTKTPRGVVREDVFGVRFVPMTGKVRRDR